MSWFNTTGFTTLAKSALTQAQKTIDKALDIHEDPIVDCRSIPTDRTQSAVPAIQDKGEDFFAAFGLDERLRLSEPKKELHVEADASIKSSSVNKNDPSIWGSFTGSFFDARTGGRNEVFNMDFVEKSQKEKQELSAMALQPKNVSTVLSRHLTASDEGNAASENAEDNSTIKDNLLKPRVRSSSESVLCLAGTLDKLIHEQSKAKSLVIVDLSVSEREGSLALPDPVGNVEEGNKTIKEYTEVTIKKIVNIPTVKSDADEVHELPDNVVPYKLMWDDPSQSFPLSDSLQDKSTIINADSYDLSVSSDIIDNLLNANQDVTTCILSDNSRGKESVDSTEKVGESLLSLSDSKLGSTSLCSMSSSSTTGESSSTLDESVLTLSAVSEKDDHSSTTLTPELFSDLTEYSIPVGLSSSWDVGNVPQNVDLQISFKAGSNEQTRSLSWNESSQNAEADLFQAFQEPGASLQEENVLNETSKKSLKTTGFVCYMLEAAMSEEPVQPKGENRSNSPRSTSSTSSTAERSDPVKIVESEQNSGHTSGEEVETTTSSDIEIISSPSAGGESGCERAGSLSPIKQSSQWRRKVSCHSGMDGSSRQIPGSMRSESPASDTSSTKDSIPVQYGFPSFFRPDLSFTQISGDGSKGHHRSNKSEASSDESEGSQAKMDALLKKLAEVNTILEARENKVLELSRENVELRDHRKILETKFRKAEEVHVAYNRDVSALTKEFIERLSITENKLQQAIKEKNSLTCELQQATQELSTRVSFFQVEEIKKEKDLQIGELMQEGEKLSKQLLGYSNNVKKLRAKEKDNENHIKQQREKLEEQSRELDRIRKALGAKEEVETNQIELIRQLASTVQKYEKDLANEKSDLEDAHEKQRSMKVAMDSAYKELAELHRKTVERDLGAQEAALSVELVAKEELKACLERAQLESHMQQENLMTQIEDLRMTVIRNENQASLREDSLRQEIGNLQQRLQEAEGINEELNQNLSAATKPLLRQISNLQSTLNTQNASWDRLERNLTDRLNEAQNQLAYAIEKELTATERYAEISSNVASLEAQNTLLRQEKTNLQAQLTSMKDELHLVQERNAR